MNTGVNYKLFYEILLNLREIFHRHGRIDDSNAKLDEIVKLILLSYYEALHGNQFSLAYVKEIAVKEFSDGSKVAPALHLLFDRASECPLYRNADGTSIFGVNASLNIQPSENLFAERVISEIEKIDFCYLIKTNEVSNFDLINECFGHFVRENFRNNKEDAQYMTPAEITLPVVSMIFDDFIKEDYFNTVDLSSFTVMDPTCGVGTLLIEAARAYINYLKNRSDTKESIEDIIDSFLRKGIVGQDKVDRMVRLSKINTLLMGANSQNIHIGNSISGDSEIDSYNEKVDFIFTNPPFGAEYPLSQLPAQDYPALKEMNVTSQSICSELLLLLKCISLLKPNGKLAIVLPDSVFSAKGLNAYVRDYILNHYTINAVIEMPAVTFAQAGTRTKTSILYLTKSAPNTSHKITMGICDDIGYTVKERLGVPIKQLSGTNEMEAISECYRNRDLRFDIILCEKPSVTKISTDVLIDRILNPSFYSADRLQTLNMLETCNVDGFEMKQLSEIARFVTIGRKNSNTSDRIKHISVLHINPDCTIDFQQVLSYDPISKGRQCLTGDILFAKINPRIPRMTVVPHFEKQLVCSNEFEILQPCADVGPYAICFLLKTSYVYKQIENLTSGTSSSHSRIKREQLANIKVPYPISNDAKRRLNAIDSLISNAFERKYEADIVLRTQLSELESLL